MHGAIQEVAVRREKVSTYNNLILNAYVQLTDVSRRDISIIISPQTNPRHSRQADGYKGMDTGKLQTWGYSQGSAISVARWGT